MIPLHGRQWDAPNSRKGGRNHLIDKASAHLMGNVPIIEAILWTGRFVFPGHDMPMPAVANILDERTVQLHVFELLVPVGQGGDRSAIMRGGIERDMTKCFQPFA